MLQFLRVRSSYLNPRLLRAQSIGFLRETRFEFFFARECCVYRVKETRANFRAHVAHYTSADATMHTVFGEHDMMQKNHTQADDKFSG